MMVCVISPNRNDYDITIETLKFAQTVKNRQIYPKSYKINMDILNNSEMDQTAEVKAYLDELSKSLEARYYLNL